jgi:hypothetical protein
LAGVAEAVCDGPVVHEAPAVVAERSKLMNYLQICVPIVSISLPEAVVIQDAGKKFK